MSLKLLIQIFCLSMIFGCTSIQKKSKQLIPGVTTEDISTSKGQKVFVASIDPKQAHLEIVRANTTNGLEKPSVVAKKLGAVVAVNGGFFTREGRPVGALKINGKWLSYPSKLRGVVGISKDGRLIFDRIGKNERIFQDASRSYAPPSWWEENENIIGGAPLIVFNSKVLDPAPEKTLSSFLNSRYARTAICRSEKNQIKFVVVNGGDRTANKFVTKGGMTIGELSSFLVSLGCIDALNLDGGYSSSFIENNKRRNRFSIGFLPERSVATMIMVRAGEANKTQQHQGQ